MREFLQRKEKDLDHSAKKRPGNFSRPFSSAKSLTPKASCACGGGCPSCQTKTTDLPISKPNDPAELEADRIADTIMRMPAGSISKQSDSIQRKAKSGALASTPNLGGVLSGGGQKLDAGTRAFFEPRFGQDLGHVRVHTDSSTAEFSENINARAFTTGSNIAFADGQYVPGSESGQKLLAHELTHVIQQTGRNNSNGISRQIKETGDGKIQREELDRWKGQDLGMYPANNDNNDLSGIVMNSVFQSIWIDFDSSNCILSSTVKLKFMNVDLEESEFLEIKDRYLRIANEKFDGWFEIKAEDDIGFGCAVCTGKPIKIDIRAIEDDQQGTELKIKSGKGRENSGRIFDSTSDMTMWHEGGHNVLGHLDEYEEEGRDNLVIDDDFSLLANSPLFGNRSRLHERHFKYLEAWLSRRFPDCIFTLVPLRNDPIGFDIEVGGGLYAASLGGEWGLGLGLDAAVGLPLDTLYRLKLMIGAYSKMLIAFDPPSRSAYLFGALFGLEYASNLSGGGVGARLDARFGAANLEGEWSPTVEGSAQLGYSSLIGSIAAEFGMGKFLREDLKDELPYFYLGLNGAIAF